MCRVEHNCAVDPLVKGLNQLMKKWQQPTLLNEGNVLNQLTSRLCFSVNIFLWLSCVLINLQSWTSTLSLLYFPCTPWSANPCPDEFDEKSEKLDQGVVCWSPCHSHCFEETYCLFIYFPLFVCLFS